MRYALLAVVLTTVGALGWALGRWAADQPLDQPTVRVPDKTEPISPSPSPPVYAPDPIQGQSGPQIIERRETIRDDDDDDDEPTPPRIEVNVPSSDPAPSQQPTEAPTTRPPALQVPELPEVPDLNLPLLP